MSRNNIKSIKFLGDIATPKTPRLAKPKRAAKKAARKVKVITPKSLGLKVRCHGIRVGDAFNASRSWRLAAVVVVTVDLKTLQTTVRYVSNGHARKIKMARLQSEHDFTRLGVKATKAAHRELCARLNSRSGR